ncbi:MAG: VOC family protein [Geminicoccaceae bacterium]
MQLARIRLRVRSPETLARFYVERLGMTLSDQGDVLALGYGGDDAALELRQATSPGAYVHRREDRYWKIGITLPNVDIAHAQLREAGVEATAPRQFGEIGYMCHLQDPEGFPVELLQHRFDGNRREGEGDPSKRLGGGARIGQITLRVSDLEGTLQYYRDRLDMRLLSIQPLPDYGFTLYFLAFTDEHPPHDDLEAVGNREWLWQRPYTTLELQHFPGADQVFMLPSDGAPGFAGIAIKGAGDLAGEHADERGGPVALLP